MVNFVNTVTVLIMHNNSQNLNFLPKSVQLDGFIQFTQNTPQSDLEDNR